jgi:hypothetical protein
MSRLKILQLAPLRYLLFKKSEEFKQEHAEGRGNEGLRA